MEVVDRPTTGIVATTKGVVLRQKERRRVCVEVEVGAKAATKRARAAASCWLWCGAQAAARVPLSALVPTAIVCLMFCLLFAWGMCSRQRYTPGACALLSTNTNACALPPGHTTSYLPGAMPAFLPVGQHATAVLEASRPCPIMACMH